MTKHCGCGIIPSLRKRKTFATPFRWCGSMAEQLICNQQVVGSTPITSSNGFTRVNLLYGGFPERPKGADCKSVVDDFGGPNPPSPTNKNRTFVYRQMFCFCLSKPQAWHIIDARSAAYIIKGALRPCISSRASVHLPAA